MSPANPCIKSSVNQFDIRGEGGLAGQCATLLFYIWNLDGVLIKTLNGTTLAVTHQVTVMCCLQCSEEATRGCYSQNVNQSFRW